MFDWDVIIIGGGPAGLTAGLYLSRGRIRTLLIEGESYGGKIKNLENIENYPGFAAGISGALLANEMQNQAEKSGLKFEQGLVSGIEIYSSSKCVTCQDGRSYTTSAIILASGSRPRKLNVPGEEALTGKGIFTCALCDGGQFENKVVVVRGGGDAGLTEALYMTKIASKVIVIAGGPELTASAILRERAAANPKIEIHCSTQITAVIGRDKVEAVETARTGSGSSDKALIKTDGVLVHVGLIANTDFLPGNIVIDDQGQIEVNSSLETAVPLVLAAGDVRSGSPGQVSTAVGDGAAAAIGVMRQLEKK
jgi:thioredoxin reductase (NADPH)